MFVDEMIDRTSRPFCRCCGRLDARKINESDHTAWINTKGVDPEVRLFTRQDVEGRFGVRKRILEIAVARNVGPKRMHVNSSVRFRVRGNRV